MLKLNNISKSLEQFSLKNINLTIKENEYFVILGPTGTGKTILLELIAGLLQPDTGTIVYNKQELTFLNPEDREIAMVYQDYMLFPHMSVKENILYGLEVQNYDQATKLKKLREVVELVGITHLIDRDIDTLSGGEQQRVALARGLIISPEILVLDEPLSALDPGTKENLQQELKKIHDQQGTITIHVTHDFNEALVLADRIAIMQAGEIIQTGYPEETFKLPNSNFVADFLGKKNIFKGQVVKNDNKQFIKVNNKVFIEAVTEKKGTVNLTIPPDEIIISYSKFESSARNSFSGRIVKVRDKISMIELKVDIGIKITVIITRHSLNEMELKSGDKVYLTFKASAVHIY